MLGPVCILKIDKENVVNPNIRHHYVRCTEGEKLENIVEFLKERGEQQGIIFCRTRQDTIDFGEALKPYGFSNVVLHGDLMQSERDKYMRMFKKGRVRILITTDVSARGIDVDDLAFDPTTGSLWGVANAGGEDTLITINKTTGAVIQSVGEFGVLDVEHFVLCANID